MKITDLLSENRIASHGQAGSKKRVLELLSELLGNSDDAPSRIFIFDALFERERLGSTGLGHGIAIPHGRMDGVKKPVGALVHLQDPINFDAPDGKPVDLVFGLLVPGDSTTEHLDILSHLAGLFADEQLCEQLRACTTREELARVIDEHDPDARESA